MIMESPLRNSISHAPPQQVAAWLDQPGPTSRLRIRNDLVVPEPGPGELLVRLQYSGVCHSDLHGIHGETPMSTNIPGHEGVGSVVKVGIGVDETLLGTTVGLAWLYSACNSCQICTVNLTACPNQHNTGRDRSGTFCRFAIAEAAHVVPIPSELALEHVAPLLCAGITMFSALAKANLKPDQWVIIPGAGGGLGHLGVQIARHYGYRVIAIDAGSKKRHLCLGLGATSFIDFAEENVEDEVMRLTKGFGAHAVVVGAESGRAYEQGFQLLRNLGTLVCVGLPPPDFQMPIGPFTTVLRGLRIVGSSVGTPQEMQQMLQLAAAGIIKPQVELFDLEQVDQALSKLEASEIGGRAVLKIV